MMNVLKSQKSSMPDAISAVVLALFVAIITGVLISPSDAVHGLNHDYHAAFQKRDKDPRDMPAHAESAGFSQDIWCAWCSACVPEARGRLGDADSSFSMLTIIQTWRLLL